MWRRKESVQLLDDNLGTHVKKKVYPEDLDEWNWKIESQKLEYSRLYKGN
jgi:hypothetical protein